MTRECAFGLPALTILAAMERRFICRRYLLLGQRRPWLRRLMGMTASCRRTNFRGMLCV